jgi:hypothetical protein
VLFRSRVRQGTVTTLGLSEPVTIEGVNLRSDDGNLVGAVTLREVEDASAHDS